MWYRSEQYLKAALQSSQQPNTKAARMRRAMITVADPSTWLSWHYSMPEHVQSLSFHARHRCSFSRWAGAKLEVVARSVGVLYSEASPAGAPRCARKVHATRRSQGFA